MPSSLCLMKLSPKQTKYSDTKPVTSETRKLNNSLLPIKLTQIKVGHKQQQKRQKAYNLVEPEQLTTEWKLGQDKNRERNLRLSRIGWKWAQNISKFMGHHESHSKRQVHCTKYLHRKEKPMESLTLVT